MQRQPRQTPGIHEAKRKINQPKSEQKTPTLKSAKTTKFFDPTANQPGSKNSQRSYRQDLCILKSVA